MSTTLTTDPYEAPTRTASPTIDQVGDIFEFLHEFEWDQFVVVGDDGHRWLRNERDGFTGWVAPDGSVVDLMHVAMHVGFAAYLFRPTWSNDWQGVIREERAPVDSMPHRQFQELFEPFREFEITKFSPPAETLKEPSWATVVGPWTWVAVDDVWQRSIDAEIGGNVLVQSWQRFDAAGRVSTDDEATLSVVVEGDAVDVATPEDARRIADELYAAADVLDEVIGNGQRTRGTRPANLIQKAFVTAVREQIKARRIGQNEFAIGAGFGPDEFSALMTGGSLMDTRDMTLIAQALGMDGLDLWAMATEMRDS